MNKSDFGARLRAERTRLRMTQEELGEKVGVGQWQISTWETGRAPPRLSSIDKLEAVLGPSSAWNTPEARCSRVLDLLAHMEQQAADEGHFEAAHYLGEAANKIRAWDEDEGRTP